MKTELKWKRITAAIVRNLREAVEIYGTYYIIHSRVSQPIMSDTGGNEK